MPARLVIACALLIAAAAPARAEVVIVAPPNIVLPLQRKPPEFPNGLQPGHASAKGPADPGALKLAWDGYTTTIVVGDGTGVARPAWVLTYDQQGDFVVGYRARAFKAADGTLHIDARTAIDSGPMAEQWIPDSFAIGPDGSVFTLDDQGHGNEGKLIERVPATSDDYQRLLLLAETLITGSI